MRGTSSCPLLRVPVVAVLPVFITSAPTPGAPDKHHLIVPGAATPPLRWCSYRIALPRPLCWLLGRTTTPRRVRSPYADTCRSRAPLPSSLHCLTPLALLYPLFWAKTIWGWCGIIFAVRGKRVSNEDHLARFFYYEQ